MCLHVPVYVCLFGSVCLRACCTRNNDNNNHIILAWHSVVVFFLKSSVDVGCVLECEIFCYLLSFTFEYTNWIFRACRNNVLKVFHQRFSCRLLLKTKVSPSLYLSIPKRPGVGLLYLWLKQFATHERFTFLSLSLSLSLLFRSFTLRRAFSIHCMRDYITLLRVCMF